MWRIQQVVVSEEINNKIDDDVENEHEKRKKKNMEAEKIKEEL